MHLDLDFICTATGGRLLTKASNLNINSIATDSRSIRPGSLFIALSGENFNGHDFVFDAFCKGAAAAIISQKIEYSEAADSGKALVQVNDTLKALQRLARAYRSQFHIPVVGITGSVGKTTTREILASCFSSQLKTLKTEQNYNNDIGLPLTLFKLAPEYDAAVVEMAMRGEGEILRLADTARPTCALITNAEPVHLEKLGSIENIARAKCEILAYLDESQFAVINGDNELLRQTAEAYPCRIYTAGYRANCDFCIKDIKVGTSGMEIELDMQGDRNIFYFPVPSSLLAINIALAAGLSNLLGIDNEGVRQGLANYKPSGNRLNIIKLSSGGAVINDTYNASPMSMLAAMETGRTVAGNGKFITVLGDMFELGEQEEKAHFFVGKKAYELGSDLLVAIGTLARHIAKGAVDAGMPVNQVYYFKNKEEGLLFLNNNINPTDTVLFKASRGMRFETLVQSLDITKQFRYKYNN